MLKRDREAIDALNELSEISARLSPEILADESSMSGWPEYRLRHTESYVHTYLGNTKKAYAAQDAALNLYPPELERERAQMLMHRARCMVIDGDVSGGIAYGSDVLDSLDQRFHNDLLYEVGRSVIAIVPHSHRESSTLREFRIRMTTIESPQLT